MRKYGTIFFARDTWFIKTEPHIALRIKRIFAKIEKDGDKIKLSDTDENCRELLWFLDRYDMEISPKDLSKLKRGSKEFREKILTLENILAGKYELSPNIKMAIPARHYQEQAAALWLKNGILLLGDEVGLGKSYSSICGLADPATRPALVCTLPHLTRQWKSEFEKFTPQIKTHILKTAKPYELRDKHGIKPDVLICNYHKLYGWADALAGEIKSIVFDECQELRCNESMKYTGALQIARKTKYAIGLSATPVFNSGSEIWNILNVLKEDVLGTRAEFEREWIGYKGLAKDPAAFGTFLREQGLMLRRTRADVDRELPPITHVPFEIEADPNELNKIKTSAAELARIIMSEAPQLQKGDKFTAAGKFDMIMRQATGIAKAPYAADFIRMLVESGEPVVAFGWHRAVYDVLFEKLADLKPAMYTGEESQVQKDESKRRFLNKETPLMIISLRAGAGLDGLQHVCRTGVFFEMDWTPGVHHQCAGRIFRDGQKDPVTMYYLNSSLGTDPMMIDILGVKKQQIDGINDPKAATIEKIMSTGQDHIKKLAANYLQRFAPVEEEGYDF